MDTVSKLLADVDAHHAAWAHLAQVRFGRGAARLQALASARAAVERNMPQPSRRDEKRTLDVEVPSSIGGSSYDSLEGGA